MPADYLSCLPSFPVEKMDPVAAFVPFQPNLKDLQLQDTDLQAIFCSSKIGHGCLILPNVKLTHFRHWHKKISLIKTTLLGSA
jgi:hypothetical protein